MVFCYVDSIKVGDIEVYMRLIFLKALEPVHGKRRIIKGKQMATKFRPDKIIGSVLLNNWMATSTIIFQNKMQEEKILKNFSTYKLSTVCYSRSVSYIFQIHEIVV